MGSKITGMIIHPTKDDIDLARDQIGAITVGRVVLFGDRLLTSINGEIYEIGGGCEG